MEKELTLKNFKTINYALNLLKEVDEEKNLWDTEDEEEFKTIKNVLKKYKKDKEEKARIKKRLLFKKQQEMERLQREINELENDSDNE